MKILFLDDEPIKHERFEFWLKHYPGTFTVVHANTADEAIQELRKAVSGGWKEKNKYY